MISSVTVPRRVTSPPRVVRADEAPPLRVPRHIPAVLFASGCVLIGVIWDISWHQSIGRDTFWSPPHLAIYLGGIVAGVACAVVVLRGTFGSVAAEWTDTTVGFWRWFRGPLGAWVCIWGTLAMLTSAPFDNWWHAAYGLDVKILSPPHALLAAGIAAINIGALLMVLPLQNRASDPAERLRYARMFVFAAGLLLLMVGTITSEYHYRIYMHGSTFYLVSALAFPLVLVAAARASTMRWPATATAAVYSGVTLVLMWVLPLFPAEPRLAPIYHHVTAMVPPSFPLLLIVPAVAMDVILQRHRMQPPWPLAVALGLVFVLLFVAAQWPFADFLMSDAARNPLFAADNFPYQVRETSYYFRGEFLPADATEGAFRIRLLIAFAAATLSARAGLAWGAWMENVRR